LVLVVFQVWMDAMEHRANQVFQVYQDRGVIQGQMDWMELQARRVNLPDHAAVLRVRKESQEEMDRKEYRVHMVEMDLPARKVIKV
jgi:hypothetical protein